MLKSPPRRAILPEFVALEMNDSDPVRAQHALRTEQGFGTAFLDVDLQVVDGRVLDVAEEHAVDRSKLKLTAHTTGPAHILQHPVGRRVARSNTHLVHCEVGPLAIRSPETFRGLRICLDQV